MKLSKNSKKQLKEKKINRETDAYRQSLLSVKTFLHRILCNCARPRATDTAHGLRASFAGKSRTIHILMARWAHHSALLEACYLNIEHVPK